MLCGAVKVSEVAKTAARLAGRVEAVIYWGEPEEAALKVRPLGKLLGWLGPTTKHGHGCIGIWGMLRGAGVTVKAATCMHMHMQKDMYTRIPTNRRACRPGGGGHGREGDGVAGPAFVGRGSAAAAAGAGARGPVHHHVHQRHHR